MRKKIIIIIGIIILLLVTSYAIYQNVLRANKESKIDLENHINSCTIDVSKEENNSKVLINKHDRFDIDIYKKAIVLAKEVYNKKDVTQKEINKAIKDLNTAGKIFDESVITPDTSSVSKSSIPIEPTIGMTANDVLQSTWGQPESKNKTITTSGTSEQWVYSNYRYVYLDNGIVTSIQTH